MNLQLNIELTLTQEMFTRILAGAFAQLDLPRQILSMETARLCDRLVWGEMPDSVAFICDRYAIVLVQLNSNSYSKLKQIYDSINTHQLDRFVGAHQINITPLQAWHGGFG
jgi:hypothetical protein